MKNAMEFKKMAKVGKKRIRLIKVKQNCRQKRQ